MCGILGSASVKINNINWIRDGLDSIAHRGPDRSGVYISKDQKICFAHNRLSIIDLTKNGNQPMVDSNNNVLTFNGEIYNYKELKDLLLKKGHQFKSNSDTEVILKSYSEWGDKCFKKFIGMFSLAIFDYEKKDIIIARDRSGEKPLFYIIQDSTLKFASELKALFKDPKQKRYLKIESLDRFLALGYVNGENSIIDGIKKLKSGHYLRFNLNTGKFKIFNYWELPYFDTNSKLSLTEITDNCEEILEDSVSRQLLSSDVPVGILLSGGIDSSLVTALASRKLKEVNTFTVTFPGYKKYDESYHSRLIAEYFGTNHQEIEANELNLSHLNDLSTQFDEPIIDSSMIPTFLVSKAISNHCKVALGGDGGDELFGGYSTYSRYLQLQNLNYLPESIKNIISISSSKFLPTGFKGRNWLMNINCDLKNYIPIPNAPFYKKERLRLFQHFNESKLLPNQIKVNYDKRSDVIQNATRFDFYNYLQEDILVKVDRSSMLNSLEIRSPFLDYRLIEFAFKYIPTNLKVNSSNKKIVLKEMCKRLLPKDFDLKRKQGFEIPLSNWLKNDLKFRQLYFDTLLSEDSIFNNLYVKQLFTGQLRGYQNSEKILGILLFELWRKKYSIKINQ